MTNQKRILGILWYEFVANEEVATLSQLPSINEAVSRRRHFLFGHVRRKDQAASAHQKSPTVYLSVMTRQAQDSLAPGEDNQVIRENAGWSSSPSAQGSFLLILGVLRRIGQHGGRYDPSTVKRRERERERERESGE